MLLPPRCPRCRDVVGGGLHRCDPLKAALHFLGIDPESQFAVALRERTEAISAARQQEVEFVLSRWSGEQATCTGWFPVPQMIRCPVPPTPATMDPSPLMEEWGGSSVRIRDYGYVRNETLVDGRLRVYYDEKV